MHPTAYNYADTLALWFRQAGVDRDMTVIGTVAVAFMACFVLARLAANRLPAVAAGEPSPAVNAPASAGQLIAAEVARSAMESGVPVAPLNAILVKLRDAGVREDEIPHRLQGAAEEIARLRLRLAGVRVEALPLVDSGDFDAASAVLQSPAPGEDDCAGRREGAELYAASAAIDRLRLDYQAAASKFAAAAALVAPPRPADGEPEISPAPAKEEWGFRMEQAGALSGDGREFANRDSFAAAIDVYRRALSLTPRPQAPQEWAATHFHLGNTLLATGELDKDRGQLEAAIDAYLLTLEEWTRERAPFDWARVQNSLGDALHLLGESESGGDFLAPAAEAYRAALQEWTRDAAPALWSMAQGGLADSLLVMGVRGGDRDRLQEAVGAYRTALEEQDRAAAPLDWAMIQNNLGNALQSLGVLETGTERLREAVQAYHAALEERTREKSPSTFATTANNLGNALLALAERDGSVRSLKEAAAAYRAAIEERARDGDRVETAKIKVNLAYALGALWSRTRSRRLIREAVALLDAAIAVFREAGEEHPLPDAESAREALLAAAGRAA